MHKTITTYKFKTIEPENYKRDEVTPKQRVRQLLTMQRLGMVSDDINIEDPDVETVVTNV